ncbi:hypothetical protein ACFL59_14470 [Planctomycetota bacterium]
MLDIEEVARLRPEEKDAVLDGILGMVYADTKVVEEELQCVRRFAAHLTDQDVETVIREYKPDLPRVGRKIAASDLGPIGRTILIRGMALVAAASGDIDEREVAFFTQCLRAFGTPPQQQKQIERKMGRHMFGDLCRNLLQRGVTLDGDGRKELEETRERLSLSAEEARLLEKHARIEHNLAVKGQV